MDQKYYFYTGKFCVGFGVLIYLKRKLCEKWEECKKSVRNRRYILKGSFNYQQLQLIGVMCIGMIIVRLITKVIKGIRSMW